MSKTISPFAGKPHTVQSRDREGNTVFRIKPRFLTPERVKLAGLLAGVSAVLLMFCGFLAVSGAGQAATWLWVAALGGPWLALPVLNKQWRSFLEKEVRIVMTTDEFRVGNGWGWRSYDRQVPHAFALLDHDKKQKEKDAQDLEVRKAQLRGEVVGTDRYYADSFHVSFEYLGQRNDLLTVYGHKEALAIRARLKACDAFLDSEARMGDGIALKPEGQWDDQPGDIRD